MKSSNKLNRQAKSLKHALEGSTYFLSTLMIFLFFMCELLPMKSTNQGNSKILQSFWYRKCVKLITRFLTPFISDLFI